MSGRRGSSIIHHNRVDSFVGSLGRQGHGSILQLSPKTARAIISGEFDISGRDASVLNEGTPEVEDGISEEICDEGDGDLLQQGLGAPSERTRLLSEERDLLVTSGDTAARDLDSEALQQEWAEQVRSGHVRTKITREIKVVIMNSAPLTVTFFLQYSLTMASLFSVGHLGKTELAAVSLASMTASVTGFAVIQGLSTCLDTLCAQAYGAGHPMLVGMYFQKCVLLILCCLLPIIVLWYRADLVLPYLVPESEKDLILLATGYLRIIAFGVPGYTLFECGKRFLQAQGIYHASTYCLVIVAPFNVLLNYFLVWDAKYGIGFYGAPIAVACSDWLLAMFLYLYVLFVDGKLCWNGFTMKVFHNWSTLFSLAIPGVIMVESEFMAFEILTLGAAYFGTEELAAQTVLGSVVSLVYQIPFALSCAASTRVANLVGAGLVDAAILSTKVCLCVSLVAVIIDAVVLYVLRFPISNLFSNDSDVIALSAAVMPWCALEHFFDGIACTSGGILRGQGRQDIGGYLNLISYYIIGLPVGLLLAFKLGLKLSGMWQGITLGLMFISVLTLAAIYYSNWEEYHRKARMRDAGV